MRNFPGFDFIRILAASAVVFSHSFLIGEGEEANEPFQAATGEILGVYGVFVFFILSGLLISESARRSPDLLSFMKKRVRRIFPAFVLCNLALVLLVAPVFAREGAAGFLADRNTWSYLAKVLSFWHSTLYYPSVAFYPPEGPDPWMPNVVNGVLWTIRQEFTCYLFVAAMMLAGLLGRPAVAIGAAAAAVLVLVPALQVTEYLGGLAFVAPSFVAGMALCELPAGHRARGPLAALSLALLAALAFGYAGWAKLAPVLFPALAAYPLLWLGQRDCGLFRRLGRHGDPSYGMYLWGWPIQQVMRAAIGPGWSGYGLALVCLPLALLAGYASWHLVERPALRGWRRVAPLPAGGARREPQRVGTGVSPR